MNEIQAAEAEEQGVAAETPVVLPLLPFPVVGIGASAGGIGALQRFMEQLPADNGMAFVIILHLSPKHESNIASILQRYTRMPVMQVTEDVRIEANHAYVIPPDRLLSMEDGTLRLSQRGKGGQPIAIDVFFRTLAEAHRERAICIVMSGTGADGAVGLTRIKELGGVALAQEPEDAEYHGMPRAAIATGMVDIVLPIVEMPQRLMELWGNAQQIRLPTRDDTTMPVIVVHDENEKRQAEDALQQIMQLLRKRTRHDFSHYKRATILRRIERRLQVTAMPDLLAYRDHLKQNAEEANALLQDMLISVTNFFRDREGFEALERQLPQLLENRSPDDPIRVWIAGCATGEEAYSVAILLRELVERLPSPPDLQLFASDISDRALAVARQGVYPAAIMTDVSPVRLRQFFVKEDDRYRVAKSIREKILFVHHNVLGDPPFSRLDLICCRNLLIYVDREAQASILETFRFALKPKGLLFLGSSESADAAPSVFATLDKKHRVFRIGSKAGPPRPPVAFPSANLLTSTAEPPRAPLKRTSSGDLHRRLLEEYAPPSALVDSRFEVLHLSKGMTAYLEHGSGVPTHNLLTNVLPALRLELRTAIYQCTQAGKNAETRAAITRADGSEQALTIKVRSFHDADSNADLILVVFDETMQANPAAALNALDPPSALLVQQLEHEARQLKEQLQDTIEHAETSTEELKASNEELQAINEELRSATEELETSKEELQSINEELNTVNHELKIKVEEKEQIADDLQNLISSSDIATVFVDTGMRIERFTPRAVDLFNFIGADIGRSLFDITHRLEYDRLAEDAGEAFQSLKRIERRVRATDGRHYLAHFLPYRTAGDRIGGAVLSFVDITALHRAEEAARASEQRLGLVAETTRDFAIITTDEEGQISSWNHGALRLFGYREEEALGQPLAILFVASDRTAAEREFEAARRDGSIHEDRYYRRQDGDTVYCSGVTSVLQGGALKGFSTILRDMSGSKRLEAEREALLLRETASRVQAQTANKMKDEFLAVMSHELKHPLNLINVNAELLSRMPETRKLPAVRRSAEVICRTVMSQSRIIDDLLDLSRARTGKMTLTMVPNRLCDFVEPIVNAMGEDARTKGVQLRLVCENRELIAVCDALRTEQIVWNLLSNALKVSNPGGEIVVELTADEQEARLTVTDTGSGIPPEVLPKIFEMFSQHLDQRARHDGGMGIGLALVRELALGQGGRVVAESLGVGRGARFSVWLPMVGKPAASADAAPTGSLSGTKILLVDDSAEALESMGELLRLDGAVVDAVGSGKAALERLANEPFDLLISDIGMPEMDGLQLVDVVRAEPALKMLPAIAFSGYSRDTDIAQSLARGFNAHLAKPTSIETVRELVLRLLQR